MSDPRKLPKKSDALQLAIRRAVEQMSDWYPSIRASCSLSESGEFLDAMINLKCFLECDCGCGSAQVECDRGLDKSL